MRDALEGLRVLDFSRVLAGPYCTMILGDLGAEVVKIEAPGRGDDARQWGPPFAGGESAYFLAVNRNKRSVTLDLKSPDGRAIARRLAARADILVENFHRGAMERFGLGEGELRADNPGLVYCSISAYGPTGPYRDRPGYDFAIQAIGGIMSLTGEPDGEPMKVGVAIVDITAGLYAATAILAALRARDLDGRGQHVEVSLYQAQLAWLANVGSSYLISGEPPRRHGNAHPSIVPYQLFRCRDGYLALAVGNDAQFRALCDALELPGLADDPRYATNPARVEHRDALVPLLSEHFGRRDVTDWLATLEPRGVPAAPINSLDRVFTDPQTAALGAVVHADHPTAGRVPMVRWPFELSETPGALRRPPPTLGADTNAILADELGLTSDEIAGLRERGAI